MGLHNDVICIIVIVVLKPIWLWKCFTIHITNCRRYLPCVNVLSKSRAGFLFTYIRTCPTKDLNWYNVQLLSQCFFIVHYCTHLSWYGGDSRLEFK